LNQRPSFKAQGWVFIILFFIILWHKPILRIFFVLNYSQQIKTYSRMHQVNPAMISAIIFVESRFNAGARSHKGALGLMQIMPPTGAWVAGKLLWKNFSDRDLLDPDKNLKVGIWYIAYLKRQYNQNDYLALASYNAGSRYVSEWLAAGIWDGDSVKVDQIPFQETKKYLIKIMIFKRIYRYLYPEYLS
jgi:soluble lytic murein transglycosylase